MRQVLPAFMAAFVLLAWTSAEAQQCSRYDRWSTDAVDQLTARANQISGNGSLPDCQGSNWYVCKEVDDLIFEAGEHLDQVFRGEAMGPNYRCRNCEMDALLYGADVLRAWYVWLDNRYYKYRGAYGNLLETFSSYKDLPRCTGLVPVPPSGTPPQAAVRCPTLPGGPLESQPSLYFETHGAMITDRGYFSFYYNPSEDLYCGYPAVGATADFTGIYLRQEGNGFVFYGDAGGVLERRVYCNRQDTFTDSAGKVWDRGVRVDAATGRELGAWQSHWNR